MRMASAVLCTSAISSGQARKQGLELVPQGGGRILRWTRAVLGALGKVVMHTVHDVATSRRGTTIVQPDPAVVDRIGILG